MDFTIYSIGSAPFLHEIIMAVTSIINAGSYSALVAVGLLIGILTAAFQGMASGGRDIPIFPVAVGALLFALMFGPKVDLAIEDVYSAEVRSVSDVPIGIAAPGSFISQIGYRLARTFETAFQPVGVTAPTLLTSEEGGGAAFADALKLLNNVRRSATAPSVLEAFDQLEGGSFRQSWDNYIRECVAIKVDRGETTMEQIYAAADHVEALRFDNPLFGTEIIHGGARQQLSCGEAYEVLNDWTDSGVASDEVWGALARLSGRHHTQGYDNSLGADPAAALDQQITSMSNSMQSLVEAGAGAQQYIRTALLEPIFQESMAGRYTDLRDFSTAAMINSALQQRNIQWASEQTIFMSIVRPMITFIEGFSYAIMPFLGFILVMGAAGMKLAVKYGQMLLWIQLWLPVLAITNFFLYMVASHDLANTPGHTTSFYALHHAADRMGHWIAVGGMLAAATPVLTLVLLTGSTYAMTSMAQRMQGADHVNEKQLSPDVMQQGAVLNNMADTTNSAGQAALRTGMEAHLPSLQLGSTSQAMYASASQEMSQAQSGFASAWQQAQQETSSQQITAATERAFGRNLSSVNTEAAQATRRLADAISRDHGTGSMNQEQFVGQLGLAGGLGVGNLLNAGGRSGVLGSQGISVSQAEMQKYMDEAGFTTSHAAQLSQTLSSSLSDKDTAAEGWGLSDSTQASLVESAQRLESASESYSETYQLSDSVGFTRSVNMAQAASEVARDDAAMGKLESFFMNHPAGAAMQQDLTQLEARYGDSTRYGFASDKEARAAAMMSLMQNRSSYANDDHFRDGASALVGAYGQASGLSEQMNTGDARANEGTANPTDVEANRGFGAASGANASQMPGARTPANGDDLVRADNANNLVGVGETATGESRSQLGAAVAEQVRTGRNENPSNDLVSLRQLQQRLSGNGGNSSNLRDFVMSSASDGQGLRAVEAFGQSGASRAGAASALMNADSIDQMRDMVAQNPNFLPSDLNAEQREAAIQGIWAGANGEAAPQTSDPTLNAIGEIGRRVGADERDMRQPMDDYFMSEYARHGSVEHGLSPGEAMVYSAAFMSNPTSAEAAYNTGQRMIEQELREQMGDQGSTVTPEQLNNRVEQISTNVLTGAQHSDAGTLQTSVHARNYRQSQGSQ